jgi:hypothetical protein
MFRVTFELIRNLNSSSLTLVPVNMMRYEGNPAFNAVNTSPGLTASKKAPSENKIFNTARLEFALAA